MKCLNPKCNLEGAYLRLKTQEVTCRMCGAVIPLPKVPKALVKKVKDLGHKEIDKQK